MSVKAFRTTLLALLSAATCPLFGDGLATAEAVSSALKDPANTNRTFSFRGTLRGYYATENNGWICSVGDATNSVEMLGNTSSFPHEDFLKANRIAPGDEVAVSGFIQTVNGRTEAHHTRIDWTATGRTGTLPLLSPTEIYAPRSLRRLVRVRGIVRDAARDESDPNFIHLTLADAQGSAQAMIIQPTFLKADFLSLIGCEVIACGICSDNTTGLRRHIGRLLSISGLENVEVVAGPKAFADAPELKALNHSLPLVISGSGFHRTEGTVLASWNGTTFLLKTDDGEIVRVHLQANEPPPCGTRVEALGLPVTDYYHINLIHATWQSSTRPPLVLPPPRETTPQALLLNDKGYPQLMMPHHGEIIRLVGIVRYLPATAAPGARLQIESNGQLVSVEANPLAESLKDLSLGSKVAISGACVMNADDWHIDSTVRPPAGFFLVPRTESDLLVLSHPSWWTPKRLMSALILGLGALLSISIWNVMLNRRAKAKGRELASEHLARAASELKVRERTRLAVELHDALSQTLTGISMQIDTAAGLVRDPATKLSRCLTLASRTIDACRTELRNTLWDLRNAALDEPNFNTAIHKTLRQNLSDTALAIRFPVSRQGLPDETVHAVLRIIRELVSNAFRHGKATRIRIAGIRDAHELKFAVRDNGCGFDPETAPGICEGHFGLQGISERLEHLDGSLDLRSAPGRGTRVCVTIPLPDFP